MSHKEEEGNKKKGSKKKGGCVTIIVQYIPLIFKNTLPSLFISL